MADMQKDKVVSSISHELRTPINALMGIFKMMEKQTKDNKIQYFLGLCENNAKLLQNIVNSILDLQLLRETKLKLNISNFKLRDLMLEIKDIFEFQASKKLLRLDLSIDKSIPEILVSDKERLT